MRMSRTFLIVLFVFAVLFLSASPPPLSPSPEPSSSPVVVAVVPETPPPLFDAILDPPLHFLNDTTHLTISSTSLRGTMTMSHSKYFDDANRTTTFILGARTINNNILFVALPRGSLPYVDRLRIRNATDVKMAYDTATQQIGALVQHNLTFLPSYFSSLYPDLVRSMLEENTELQSLLTLLQFGGHCVWLGNITISSQENSLTGVLESTLCNISASSFTLTTDTMVNRYDALTTYMLLTIFLGIIHNLSILSFLRYSLTSSHVLHISYVTAVWTFMFDFCILCVHLAFARTYYLASRGLIACGFFHFVLFSMWDSKILSRLHSLHYPTDGIWWHYFRLWLGLVVCLSVMNEIRVRSPLVAYLVMYSMWVPQIIYNATQNTVRGSPPLYVAVTTLTRLWFLGYFFAYSDNFAPFETHGESVIATIVWCALQVAVVTAQTVWKTPSFFLPIRFRPSYYNYFRTDINVTPDMECAICQGPMLDGGEGGGGGGQLAVTPCSHVFHAPCLLQWADVKLVCPICRRPMPPPP